MKATESTAGEFLLRLLWRILPPRRQARQGGITRRREGAKNGMAQGFTAKTQRAPRNAGCGRREPPRREERQEMRGAGGGNRQDAKNAEECRVREEGTAKTQSAPRGVTRRCEGGCGFVGKGLPPRCQARQECLTRRREGAKNGMAQGFTAKTRRAPRDAGCGRREPPRRKERQECLTRRREGAKNGMA